MAAGITRKQEANARRRILQRIAREFGGRYSPATASTWGFVHGIVQSDPSGMRGEWAVYVRTMRASNGEVVLLPALQWPSGEYVTVGAIEALRKGLAAGGAQ